MHIPRKPFVWQLVAALISGIGMAFIFWSFVQMENASIHRMHYRQVSVLTDNFLLAMKDAQLEERNYLITGDERFWRPQLQARSNVTSTLQELRKTADIPAARAELDAVAPLVEVQLNELANTVALRRDGTIAAALAQVQGGEGQRLTSAVRTHMDAFVQIQNQAELSEESAFAYSVRRLFSAIVIMGLLVLLFTLSLAAFSYRLVHRRTAETVHDGTQYPFGVQQSTPPLLDETIPVVSAPAHSAETGLANQTVNTVVDSVVTFHARGGAIESTNPATEALFGYTAAELKGRGFDILVPEFNQINQSGELAYFGPSADARATGKKREAVGLRKDGSQFVLEVAVSEMLLSDERFFTALLRDISNREAVEKAQRKAGALQRAIFRSTIFSSIATDVHGVIHIFNLGAQRMLGYSATDVTGTMTPADLSDPQELVERAQELSLESGTKIMPGLEALVFKASRGIEDIYELTYIHKDGNRVPALVSVTALRDEQEAIIGYLLIATDNARRKVLEADRVLLDQALKSKIAELESARPQTNQASWFKSELWSYMGDDLRKPLNAMSEFTQSLVSGSPHPTATQKRSLDEISKANCCLLESLNGILDLAKIESGNIPLSMEPVSLKVALNECQTTVAAQAQRSGVHVVFNHCDVSQRVQADRMRLKQVLINLLGNAIKHNRVDSTVAVDFNTTDPSWVRVIVYDTGAGPTREQLAQLFPPFNHLGQNRNKEEGCGIGLAVCKRLVELMGGQLGFANTTGGGSVTWLQLASAPAAPAAGVTPSAANNNEHTPAELASKLTVLYVEDNPANQMLVEALIARQTNVGLLTANDGRIGIEMARAHLPDVILMDINLPGISGIDAMRVLASDATTAHIPVIALSANAIPQDIEKGLETGFLRYLTKPIKIDTFMEALNLGFETAAKVRVDKAGRVASDVAIHD